MRPEFPMLQKAAPLKGNHEFASFTCKIAAHALLQPLLKLGP
jgi:hypothetical protein